MVPAEKRKLDGALEWADTRYTVRSIIRSVGKKLGRAVTVACQFSLPCRAGHDSR